MQARVISVVMDPSFAGTGLEMNSQEGDTGPHDDSCARSPLAGQGPRQLAGRQWPPLGGATGLPGARRRDPPARARRTHPPGCRVAERTRAGVGAGIEPDHDHVVVFGAPRRGVSHQPSGVAQHGGAAARGTAERIDVPGAPAGLRQLGGRPQLRRDGRAGRGGRAGLRVCVAITSAVPPDARHGAGGDRRAAGRDRGPVSGAGSRDVSRSRSWSPRVRSMRCGCSSTC